MPRGNKRYFSTRPLNKLTEHKTKHETNPFRVDNISETSGDSISLSEKPTTSKHAVQYPTRTFENRSALEAFKTGHWKKHDKEHNVAANTKKKTQRKQNKRSFVNFNAFNYSDPEDYGDADSYSNGPTMRYVDVARSALCSRSSPTPIQKIQQKAPNLDLHEFPYLKSNKIKNSDSVELQNERSCCTDVIDTFEIEETEEEFQTKEEIAEIDLAGVQENEMVEAKVADVDALDFGDDEQTQHYELNESQNEQTQENGDEEVEDEDEEEEEEQLVHPLAFQSLSPYPSSSFVYINPNMENNFDYIEPTVEKSILDFNKTACISAETVPEPTTVPAPAEISKSSFIEKFSMLENESEYETSSNYGDYGAGDYAASSDSCTIQHSETTSEYAEAQSSDGVQRDDTHSGASEHGPLSFEWLEMMVQLLSGPFHVVVPNFNFLEAHRDFPRLERQFEDNNYLRLEERALFGLRIAENKGFFKDGPYM